jgi:hypothetical protein
VVLDGGSGTALVDEIASTNGSDAVDAAANDCAMDDAMSMVIAVARYGEADLLGWWRSHGLDGVGEYILPELFPRTALVAGAEVAVFSAAKRHLDALPDRDDVVHLFGEPLPAFEEAVAWLAELKTGGDQSFLQELRGWTTRDAAHVELTRLTGEVPLGERIGATLRLGKLSSDDLVDPDRARRVRKFDPAANQCLLKQC